MEIGIDFMEDINICYLENKEINPKQKLSLIAINEQFPKCRVLVDYGDIEVRLDKEQNVCVFIDEDGLINGKSKEYFLKRSDKFKTVINKFNSLYKELERLKNGNSFLTFYE